MKNRPRWQLWFLLTVMTVVSLVTSVWATSQEEGVTDIVFALDVSSSMRSNNNFGKVRDRLIEFIKSEVDLGAHLAVVTFGEEAKLVAKQQITTDADKAKLIKRIQKMKADARATYMAAGIDMGLQLLQTLAKEHPHRSRILILLTDGQNQPPRSVPPERRITFDKLRERYAKMLDFKQGKDWFFWYCFIGKPNKPVQEFVEAMGGESKPVTGRWRFLKVWFNRAIVDLGDVPTGDWTMEFPARDDRQLGELLLVTTQAPGEYKLELSDVILDDPGPNERVTVSPHSIRMDRLEQLVVLVLKGQNIVPGERRGRIVIRSPGKMVFVKPQQFHVRFRGEAAHVSIAPSDGVRFGRLTLGKSMDRTIELIPNEMAKRLATDKLVRLILPKDLPHGVQLRAEPASLQLDNIKSVQLKLIASADANLPPEGYKGAVGFSDIPGVRFAPQTLGISFEVSRAEVDVTPDDRVNFGVLQSGQRQTRSLWLSPNIIAATVKPTVRLSASGIPEGASVVFEPRQVTLDQKREIKVTVVAGPQLGQHKLKLNVTCDSPAIRLSVTELEAVYSVETARITIDADKLFFHDIFEGESSPSARVHVVASQGAIGDTVHLDWKFDGIPEGMSVVPSQQQITISQPSEDVTLVLTLKGAIPGQYDGRVKFSAKSQLEPQEIPLRIELITKRVEIIKPSGPWIIKVSAFAPKGTIQLPIVLRANPAAAGSNVFLEHPAEMLEEITISAEPERFKLVAGENEGTLKAVVSLRPSLFGQSYTGKLKLIADSEHVLLEPDTVRWEVVIPGLLPYAVSTGMVVAVLLILLLWLRWPRIVTGGLTVETVGGGEIRTEGLVAEVGEEISLIAMNKRHIKIGPGERCSIVLASGESEPEPGGEWAVRLDRRRKKYLRRSATGGQSVSIERTMGGGDIETVGARESTTLEHGDKITIGSFTFTFQDI